MSGLCILAAVKIYRSSSASKPTLGKFSYWSEDRQLASGFAGFHVPHGDSVALYQADVDSTLILDLRTPDPWLSLEEATGIELHDRIGLRHELVHGCLDEIAGHKFEWLVRVADYALNDQEHRIDGPSEWIYLGDGTVPASLLQHLEDDWLEVNVESHKRPGG